MLPRRNFAPQPSVRCSAATWEFSLPIWELNRPYHHESRGDSRPRLSSGAKLRRFLAARRFASVLRSLDANLGNAARRLGRPCARSRPVL